MDNFNKTRAFGKRKQNVNCIESQLQQAPSDTEALSATWCYSAVGLMTDEFTVFYVELQELLQKGVDCSFALHHAFFLATFFLQIKVVFSAFV